MEPVVELLLALRNGHTPRPPSLPAALAPQDEAAAYRIQLQTFEAIGAPVGGWKASIFGDHGIYGMEGVRFYTKLKTITARWPTGIRSGAEFHFQARN